MKGYLSRRDFLKLCGLSLTRWGLAPLGLFTTPLRPPEVAGLHPVARGRVTFDRIYVYSEPTFQSERVGSRRKDQLLHIYELIRSPDGPRHNPRWYRIVNGFVHSAYIQRVENAHVNVPVSALTEKGWLGEITVPYTQSLRRIRKRWDLLYRLYYGSIFWVTHIDEGPDGKPWYGLTDDLLHVQYFVPAAHVRLLSPGEFEPISPEVPWKEKRVEVSIRNQTMSAYEGDQLVYQTKVSTGIPSDGPTPNGIPTATPHGHFNIQVKVPSRHMGDGNLTSDRNAYELPGVPWVSFFHITGVAFHGTYWHDNFGRMMSHGCVNMRNRDANWLYRWSLPMAEPEEWIKKEHGTYTRVLE